MPIINLKYVKACKWYMYIILLIMVGQMLPMKLPQPPD